MRTAEVLKKEFLEKSKILIDLIPINIYWIDTEMNIAFCNKNQLQDAKLELKDAIGKNIKDILNDSSHRENIIKNNNIILEKKSIMEFEEVYVNNGIEIVYSSIKCPVFDNDNNISGIIGISYISKQYKKINFEQFLFYEKIVESVPVNIYLINKDGILLNCNDHQARFLGYQTKDDVIGKSVYDLVPEDISKKIIISNYKVHEKNLNVPFEEKMIVNNHTFYMLSHKVPIYNLQNDIYGVLGISLDVSDKKNNQIKIDQINKKNRMYLSLASHEIRTPISNSKSYLNLISYEIDAIKDCIQKIFLRNDLQIEEKNKDDIFSKINSLADHLNIVSSEQDRTLVSLNNLADLDKIMTEGLKPEFNIFDINILLENLVKRIRIQITENFIFNINFSNELPKSVKIDYANLYDALEIILFNAIKYSAESNVIDINCNLLEKNNQNYLTISVQDYGKGMNNDQVNRIFHFLDECSEHSANLRYLRPSLKLVAAKKKIEASKGFVTIESSLNYGTKVNIGVLLDVAESNLDFLSEEKKFFSEKNFKIKILAVDDDEVFRHLLKSQLELLDFQVEMVDSGESAVDKAKKNKYDIIILDITLPGVSGIETLQRINEFYLPNIPFIFLSSHSSPEDQAYFLSQGFVTGLTKPTDTMTLKCTIEDAIKSFNNID